MLKALLPFALFMTQAVAAAEPASGGAAGGAGDAANTARNALPTGVPLDGAPRPSQAPLSFCSFERPVCVQAPDGETAAALNALRALEDAYERLVFGLRLPQPLADGGLGGSDALDAYLVPADEPFLASSDPPAIGPFARASAFCRLPNADPTLLRRSATLCVGEAIAMALDSAEPPSLRRGFATWLWWVAGEPTALDVQAIDLVQRHPERPIAGRELSPESEGSALFFEYLEQTLGVSGDAELATSLFAAAASPRPTGLEYDNEPDLFDVLRHTLDSDRLRFARLLSDFAVARAFIGSRDDGSHLPRLAWAGDFGRVRFDWVIPFSTLPRRVAAKPPIDSSGAMLVWLDLDALPGRTSLGFQAEWEAPVTFHWQLVRLGANGEELGRVGVPFEERGTIAEATIGRLAGASALLAVGINLETVELSHPFDPDVAPYEPHGVTVYFAKL